MRVFLLRMVAAKNRVFRNLTFRGDHKRRIAYHSYSLSLTKSAEGPQDAVRIPFELMFGVR